MSPGDAQKRAAIDLDEVAGKRLSEISAADFLQALEQVQASGESTTSAEATVGDVLAGAAATQRWSGGFPEKKKAELEKTSMEGFPEKKKVELEKQSLEGFPEKKKVELEKAWMEGFPEKKKVELEKPQIEKQSVELPSDLSTTIGRLDDRLATIEEQLSKLSK